MRSSKPARTIKQRLGVTLEKDLYAQRKLTAEEICLLISRLARMSVTEVRNVAKDSRAIDAALAQVFCQAIDYGDHNKLNFLLDRSIGKQPDIAQINNTVIADNLSEAEQRSMLKSLMDKYKELLEHGENDNTMPNRAIPSGH